jgi:hypothetical protein
VGARKIISDIGPSGSSFIVPRNQGSASGGRPPLALRLFTSSRQASWCEIVTTEAFQQRLKLGSLVAVHIRRLREMMGTSRRRLESG